MTEAMIRTEGVSKRFGTLTALDGVDVEVPPGSVLCLLGHNGAGKTTLVNILTTLVLPSSGRAWVNGLDVVAQPHRVRQLIGLTGQFASVDEHISGRANLVLLARLLGAGRAEARRRADALLEMFDLRDAARRPARVYSGGMRRRLDLAASLVGRPRVLFLDEPTTGLDPTGRLDLWHAVEELTADGTTVLLTTQLLDEADRLADSIMVLSQGKVVAHGTPAELKAQVGERTVTVQVDVLDIPAAVEALRRTGLRPAADAAQRLVRVPVSGSRDLAVVVRALDQAGVEADELAFTEPGLDEVFVAFQRDARPVALAKDDGGVRQWPSAV
jgi:ABC-2 type transport system ATP-binding protein